MAEHKDDLGPPEGTPNTVDVANEDLMPARLAIRAIKNYEHPLSREGVRQDTSLKLGRLDRVLRQLDEDRADEYNEKVDRFGERKDPDDPKSARVAKDSPFRTAFNLAIRELNRTKVPVDASLRIKQSELKVRDENGELEDMRIGRIDDLGVLLIPDGSEPATNGDAPAGRPRPRRRKAGKP